MRHSCAGVQATASYVMEHAEWARAAYERWGFVDIGGKTFSGALRPGRSRAMRVLVKELK